MKTVREGLKARPRQPLQERNAASSNVRGSPDDPANFVVPRKSPPTPDPLSLFSSHQYLLCFQKANLEKRVKIVRHQKETL